MVTLDKIRLTGLLRKKPQEAETPNGAFSMDPQATRLRLRRRSSRDTTSLGLENVFTAAHAWARSVVEEIRRKIADPATMRGLG